MHILSSTGATEKLGNRLTRRPCKGDKFETEIFEANRQNAGICGACQKKCDMDIHFDWQAYDSSVKIVRFACAVNRFCSSRVEKNIRKL